MADVLCIAWSGAVDLTQAVSCLTTKANSYNILPVYTDLAEAHRAIQACDVVVLVTAADEEDCRNRSWNEGIAEWLKQKANGEVTTRLFVFAQNSIDRQSTQRCRDDFRHFRSLGLTTQFILDQSYSFTDLQYQTLVFGLEGATVLCLDQFKTLSLPNKSKPPTPDVVVPASAAPDLFHTWRTVQSASNYRPSPSRFNGVIHLVLFYNSHGVNYNYTIPDLLASWKAGCPSQGRGGSGFDFTVRTREIAGVAHKSQCWFVPEATQTTFYNKAYVKKGKFEVVVYVYDIGSRQNVLEDLFVDEKTTTMIVIVGLEKLDGYDKKAAEHGQAIIALCNAVGADTIVCCDTCWDRPYGKAPLDWQQQLGLADGNYTVLVGLDKIEDCLWERVKLAPAEVQAPLAVTRSRGSLNDGKGDASPGRKCSVM
ncbi:MAG: hypothetical protein COB66_03740 [Coxiella sp. (in: Bacteria)]|nr:MAG: hypothetical protein COB66_03740 [Coxiella sp. (in: g-proteobacteria)]